MNNNQPDNEFLTSCRRSDLYFYRNGKIDISAKVSHELRLHPSDAINIRRQGDEFYLYVYRRNAPEGFRARVANTKNGCSFFRANCVELTRKVLSIMHDEFRSEVFTGETVSMPDRDNEPAVTLILRPRK